MCRKYRGVISWMLIAVMSCSPMLVYARSVAAGETTAQGKAKVDLGYITPKTTAALVVYPKHVLSAPGMEMLPTEVFTAAGTKDLGIDPMQVEQVVAIAEAPQTMPPQGPPRVAVVLRLAKPVDQDKLFPHLRGQTVEGQIDGKTYRKAKSPMAFSIFCPDERTVIVATDELLQDMVKNHAKPEEGAMSRMLGAVENPADANAIVLVEPIRPLIAMPLAMAPVPPPFMDAKKIPELLNSIDVKANITGDMGMSIALTANDEAAAEQLDQIVDNLLETAKLLTAAELSKQAASSDPVEQAMARYGQRMSDQTMKAVRPVRKGKTLTLATDSAGKNPQVVQMATIGILVGLLLPAVQAAREAARRAQSSNNLKQIALGLLNYEQAQGRFPPAFSSDKNGKPLLSWRVAILPYMEEEALYKQFRLDEPWDSPQQVAHRQDAESLSEPEQCGRASRKNELLDAAERAQRFSGAKGVSMADITDGTSNTIMTVEVPDSSAVEWTKPDDFAYDEEDPAKGLAGMRSGVFIAGFCDGSVHIISTSVDPATLKLLFMRDDGKPFDGGRF